MKRILKSICCLLLLFAMSFSIVGCSNNDDTNKDSNNNTTTNESDEDKGLEGIDSRVKNKFSSDYKVNRDDVNEAVNYIHDNIDDVKDKEVAKKLYEHGSYLEMAADKGEVDDDNSIRDLGISTKEYAAKVYNAKDGEVDDIIADAKVRFDQFKTDLDSGVDTAVDKFMDFFK